MSVAKSDADKLSIAYISKLEWLLLSVSFIGMLSSTILVKFSSIIVELSNSMMCVLSFLKEYKDDLVKNRSSICSLNGRFLSFEFCFG